MTEQDRLLEQLETTLLGGERRYTKAQVSDLTGVSLERADRLWRALGFADVADDAATFADDDVEALRLITRLVDQGVVDPDAEASLARSVGQALARLADWQTLLVHELSGEPSLSAAGHASVVDVARAIAPAMERLQSYVWRRHLVAAVGRLLPVASQDPRSATLAVGFADIVGFTRFTRANDDAELAGLVDHFEAGASEAVVEHDGRVIKTIGDEVLFVAYTAGDGADIALQLAGAHHRDSRFPKLRVGLAHGAVLSRLGDVYGPVVNVAARLTSLARPETVLVDRAMVRALGDDARYELRRLRKVAVRGYQRLEPWALRPGAS